MNQSPPSTQKAGERPISFLLDDGTSQESDGSQFLDLVIRPEDLTRPDSSRVSVLQTLGGGWADSFGRGLPTITISGHTGWRRIEGQSDDGADRFRNLKKQVFDQWHDRRAAAVEAGRDPNEVRLIFSDTLDGFSVVVVPMQFVLRRSRSRPLLSQYQIVMTVVDEDGGDVIGAFSTVGDGSLGTLIDRSATSQQLGLESMGASVSRINGMVASAPGFVAPSFLGSVQSFMRQTASLYGHVMNAVATGNGIAGQLVGVAQSITKAGINVFRTLAAVASIPQQAKAWLQGVTSAYTNIFCVLRNALRQLRTYTDYSGLYGSSNCSSTSGGRPLSAYANQNPFFAITPTTIALPVSLSNAAQDAVRRLGQTDPVLSPLSMPALSQSLNSTVGGMVVA